MMSKLTQRVARMQASPTLVVAEQLAFLKSQGADVISLSIGEPDFPTPEHIKEAANKAIADNFSYYAPISGYASLREAIAGKLGAENGLSYSFNEILVSTGAKQALFNAVFAILEKGDECIIPTPSWSSYVEMVKLAQAEPVLVECPISNSYKITAEQLERNITNRTKAIILCSPSNPSGSIYSCEELSALVSVLAKYPDIYIFSDEVYEHLNYVGRHCSIAQFESVKARTIIVNGVSKAYAMTGWRIGWIAADREVIKACNKLQGQTITCTCTIAMKAAEAAYKGSQDCVEIMRKEYLRRRNITLAKIKDIPGFEVIEPDGAFYLFPKIDSFLGKIYMDSKGGKHVISNANDFVMFLLNEAHVACVSGEAFMSPASIRLSYASCGTRLEEALDRIQGAVHKLL